MQSNMVTFLFYVCSFAPVFIIYGVISLIRFFYNIEEVNWSLRMFMLMLPIITILIVPIIAIAIAHYFLKKREEKASKEREMTVTEIEPIDSKNTSLLLVSAFALLNTDVLTFVLVIVLVGVLSIKNNCNEPSPVLGILGWHFYRVVSEKGIIYTLISRKTLDLQIPKISDLAAMQPYLILHKKE